MSSNCKKCLLLQAGEDVTYEEIQKYISSIDKNLTVSDNIYRKRLSYCSQCDNLISGMCLKCGCYVEVRAKLKKSDCPDYSNRKW